MSRYNGLEEPSAGTMPPLKPEIDSTERGYVSDRSLAIYVIVHLLCFTLSEVAICS